MPKSTFFGAGTFEILQKYHFSTLFHLVKSCYKLLAAAGWLLAAARLPLLLAC